MRLKREHCTAPLKHDSVPSCNLSTTAGLGAPKLTSQAWAFALYGEMPFSNTAKV